MTALRVVATIGAAVGAALGTTSGAHAVVCANGDEMAHPSTGGYVGNWNGSSGVCVAPHWVLTAKHVGGSVNGIFSLFGLPYRAVQIVPHPTMDLQLVRVAETLPGFHEIASTDSIEPGLPCVLGGFGVTAGTALSDGWNWSQTRKLTWGANTLDGVGAVLGIQFDNPATSAGVPHEALFAVNDSGGGLFIYGADGSLELAGIAVSVTGWNATRYGNAAFAINVGELTNWLMPYVDPSKPITSSVEAPRASLGHPVTSVLLMGTVATALGGRVRRRMG